MKKQPEALARECSTPFAEPQSVPRVRPLYFAWIKPVSMVSKRRFRFAALIVALSLVWCVGLPWLAKLPPVRSHIGAMREKNINVGAMFYTELEWQPPTGAAWR